MRPASESGEKPPNTTEWIAPMRAQASIADGRLGDHRQVDRDPVALLDAVRLQHVGEAADLRVQLAIGDARVLGRVVALPDDRDLVAARRRDAGRGSCRQTLRVPSSNHLIETLRGSNEVFFTLLKGLIQSMRLPCSPQNASGS